MDSECKIALHHYDNDTLKNLCGPLDENLQQIRDILSLRVRRRGSEFTFTNSEEQLDCDWVHGVLRKLLTEAGYGAVSPQVAGQILMSMRETHRLGEQIIPSIESTDSASIRDETVADTDLDEQIAQTRIELPRIRGRRIQPRSSNQQAYVDQIARYPISFGVGPAGTGKTFLAVACAVSYLMADKVERIMLVRPAVEAGERLGFLPGDISQKVDPYLRPLYDALYEMLGADRTLKLMERNRIEIAPLAFMRGRTLNHAFVILDEAQNTTTEQMKMFLTRLGFNSKMVITGDLTQVDLPNGRLSGLKDALGRVQSIEDIGMSVFRGGDIVRHPIVQSIVDVYDD